jgi:hypothetical protein
VWLPRVVGPSQVSAAYTAVAHLHLTALRPKAPHDESTMDAEAHTTRTPMTRTSLLDEPITSANYRVVFAAEELVADEDLDARLQAETAELLLDVERSQQETSALIAAQFSHSEGAAESHEGMNNEVHLGAAFRQHSLRSRQPSAFHISCDVFAVGEAATGGLETTDVHGA